MSALGLDDVNDSRGVHAYAPRELRRADDETSIRPVLERLRRSEGRVPGPRLVHSAPVEDLAPPHETVSRSAFPMAARLAVAAGVLALVGAAAAGYLPHLPAEHPAPAQAPTPSATPTSLPKPVQTVTIQRPADAQPQARIVKDDARLPQVTALAGAAEAAPPAPRQSLSNDPSMTPLRAWAAMPDSVPASPAWSPSPAQPASAEAMPLPVAAPPKPETREPAHRAAPTHHAHHAARHRIAHHRQQRTARARQATPQQPDQSAATAQAQPVKKLPLQAALDRLFGGSKPASAGNASAPQQ